MLLLIEKVLMNSRILNDMMDLQKIAYTNCYDNAFNGILKSGKGLVVTLHDVFDQRMVYKSSHSFFLLV